MTKRVARGRFTLHGPVEAQTPGGKRRMLRADDAIDWLFEAYHAPDGSEQRRALLERAMWTAVFGTVNEHKFKARGDRRGRPKGTKARAKHDDAVALAVMAQIAADTGEARPLTLARLAVDSSRVPLNGNVKRESVIRRLARRWKHFRAEK